MITPERSDRAAPMAPAPFVWRDDGRPDWGAMWTSFCHLALHGGPPHRGPQQALRGPDVDGHEAGSDAAMVAEIRRGIWETTGLYAERAGPGWIAITCESPSMARWLGAAIVLENVDARVEHDRLLLPAGPRFQLADQVKSVITVVAKTHHYSTVHGGIVAQPDDVTDRLGFRCESCGLTFQVSRPDGTADLDATCPADGAPLTRQGLVRSRPTSVTRPARIGVGGSREAGVVLIDALRRRYGRRRAVVASPAAAVEVADHAVDLILVQGDNGSEGSAFGPEPVHATIGILDVPRVVDSLREDGRAVAGWHLLVVATSGDAKVDLSGIEDRVSLVRGSRPSVFIDVATVEGIDAVVRWLQREWQLDPWRDRARPSRG